KIVDHLFILDGKGNVGDFNGTYNDYLTQKKETDKTQSQPLTKIKSTESEYELRKKIRTIENQIQKLETKKTDVENRFQQMNISPQQIKDWNVELDKIKD